jgi:hypothetical protein
MRSELSLAAPSAYDYDEQARYCLTSTTRI